MNDMFDETLGVGEGIISRKCIVRTTLCRTGIRLSGRTGGSDSVDALDFGGQTI